jgi:hypothetical protein
MATFIKTSDTPLYGEVWVSPENGKEYVLIERSFPRFNRMVCLVQEIGQEYVEYLVFPYN